jgi:predicted ribonuclease YlaK
VLRELDGLKLNSNSEVAFKARRAAVVISRNISKINFIDKWEDTRISVDDKLLKEALESNNTLITNDVYLKVKAIIAGVDTKGYGGTEDYSGIYYLTIKTDEYHYNKELETILEEHYYSGLKENEFLIIKEENTNEILAILQNQNGYLKTVRPSEIRNQWINKIYPKNPEQECLFYALQNEDNSIIYASGKYGTGKSFILNNYALAALERGAIKKIIYVPNNSYTENTMEIGSLPGELLEKVTGQIGPLVDLVGIDEVHSMINREQLEVVPMNSIRGRSFQDSIIIVNEAQNLTEDHVKLLLARCGEGTRIFFDGDYKQADSAVFRNKNGLKLLLNLRNSPEFSKIFATVRLNTTERSFTAQSAAYLDDITGGI